MNENEISMGKRFWLEFKDLLMGAAFPLMLQLILSASVILFSDYFSDDMAVGIAALVFGELLLAGAYIIFGRANGITAVRKSVQNAKKREGETNDIRALCHTGEYKLWKGFAIGALSAVPFILFQLINCIVPNTVCEFVLKYAFGWAFYPIYLAGQSQWINFVFVLYPVAVHAAAYALGAYQENKRQVKVAEASQIKGKRHK